MRQRTDRIAEIVAQLGEVDIWSTSRAMNRSCPATPFDLVVKLLEEIPRTDGHSGYSDPHREKLRDPSCVKVVLAPVLAKAEGGRMRRKVEAFPIPIPHPHSHYRIHHRTSSTLFQPGPHSPCPRMAR